ncbi:MAG: hypothetical protein ACQCXQ_12370 [Verrucomicrobiales bacterium]|nr:hypothetical protein [Verrucomicrobiota bacterium JB025]
MESHEWKEITDEGKRFYRANFFRGEWTMLTATQRRNADWETVDDPPKELWIKLRELVWNKYQRKRCPWERVVSIDRILGNDHEEP